MRFKLAFANVRKVCHVLLSGLFKCDRDRANRLTIKVLLTTANTIIVYFRRQNRKSYLETKLQSLW